MVDSNGESRNFVRGGRKKMYQPRRHLSQMHTTNYMPFIYTGKATSKKISEANRAAPTAPFESATDWQKVIHCIAFTNLLCDYDVGSGQGWSGTATLSRGQQWRRRDCGDVERVSLSSWRCCRSHRALAHRSSRHRRHNTQSHRCSPLHRHTANNHAWFPCSSAYAQ